MTRSPWQSLYGGLHRFRERWWAGRADRLPRPVVSVGNLHWGGTGKTPIVAAIASEIRDRGRRVAILSRGYGRRGRKALVVSRGHGPLVPPALGGDEPVMLAEALADIPIVVAARRAEAGRLALEDLSPPPEVFLLDDGFSHLRLARDLDLVVLPAADPLGGERLAPSGRLREPIAALARADGLVLSGADRVPAELHSRLAARRFDQPIFPCPIVVGHPVRTDGGFLPPASRVLLVTGVAGPQRVVRAAARTGLEVVGHLALGDHHRYPERTIRRIDDDGRRRGAEVVLTTAKDAVKIGRRPALPVAVLPIRAELPETLRRWLLDRLESLG